MPYPITSAWIFALRACACDSSSRTTTAAPSAITNPSRPASNGREAVAGSSFRTESARIAPKPASPTGVIGASVPPQNITSARPSRIASRPSPSAMFDAAQAVHSETQRPAGPELDRDPARSEVRQGLHDREGAHALGAAPLDLQDALLERADTADRRRDRRPGALGDASDVEARVGLRLARGRQHELRAPVHPAGRLPVDVRVDVEILHLARKPRRVAARVEPRDRPGTRLARQQGRPGILDRSCRSGSPCRGR